MKLPHASVLLASLVLAASGALAGEIQPYDAATFASLQAAGKPVDRRADVFACGVVLWEALTRRRLFVGEDASEVLRKILRDDVPPPSEFVLAKYTSNEVCVPGTVSIVAMKGRLSTRLFDG